MVYTCRASTQYGSSHIELHHGYTLGGKNGASLNVMMVGFDLVADVEIDLI